ncbi:Protein-export membrane protein SecD (TC 3.A.5.1.1) [uncultured Gammaproteobacteria bacterium]|jgi:preprotein translocase subunit SecD|uniref:protein translocase subunit SecD n=1 Tax=thiotrophic endosymbiont of Bathymodiolus puteoserpentis (Logatchev) TaxID=343240 RepID=UPI0010B80E07|nr:protein translocase subunit SecD [thiotrophic endosymbiont of Bathymodiolus puteoserpentis (Logatchev)]CAC9601176.1 Protein translocase subunit SecD [uncultured Gammaproteobacteria bacterium]CAC9988493.1 Protein translocase subunit SecD [uncultured Gammaproteobacteria bacterium]CAC9996886.1 Protein translocase subunit SecD [uncultured Gammaproteobacteria bacterium]SSC10771.1 Protein-export membrane protein SecD (TC 3.A.5.1.1) [thiotrophic endosymbiont of Bathymodiolus puteoserpentis (Logatch
MNQYSGLKNALIAFCLLLSILYALPNIFGSDLAVQVSSAGGKLVTESDLDKITDTLKSKDVNYKSVALSNRHILVRFDNNASQLSAKDILKTSLGRNYVVALNLAPSVPLWLSNLGGKAMSLGLDLRGGVHFLLEVDMYAVMAVSIDKHYNELRTLLRAERLYKSIKKEGERIVIRLKTVDARAKALKIIKSELSDLVVLETNNQDKLMIHLAISNNAQKNAKKNALKQNITTLRNRVDELGVAEPIIQQQGLERIVVQLPGVQDTARAKEILGAVATLEFRLVDERNDPQTAIQSGRMPIGSKLYYFKDGRPLLLKNRVIATGENITGAASGVDDRSAPMVNITLDSIGGRAMLDTTKKYLKHRMAVVFIENKVETIIKNGKTTKKRTTTKDIINAATIEGVFSSRFQITGIDSGREARNLALLLRAGSLSTPIEIIEERTIGPSLGADNIEKGVLSVIIGFMLVLIFMAMRYRVFGLVANIALTLNLAMIVAVLSLLQATLTLPGIAGIVLTVGMAVDANVLIFERIKEELGSNSDIQKAISSGYDKALLTIADANITTLIAALVLFSFGTGPIKGFAITLSIGIITSMFTAIIVSRAIINKIYGGKTHQELSI